MSPELASSLTTLATVATGAAAILAFALSAIALVSQSKRSEMFALASAKQTWLNQFRASVSQLLPLAHQSCVKRDVGDTCFRDFMQQDATLGLLMVGIEGQDELKAQTSKLTHSVGFHHGEESDHLAILKDLSEIEIAIGEIVTAIIVREVATVERLMRGKK